MQPKSSLHLPPPYLASCMAAAILRDTRGAELSEQDRMNYFPASPLPAVTCVLSGTLHMAEGICDLETLRATPPMPAVSVTPPQATPILSWSPGPVAALTIGFYPDAWVSLGGAPGSKALPDGLKDLLALLSDADDIESRWDTFCQKLAPIWASARKTGHLADWPGSHRLADWSRHVLTRIALAAPAKSARTLERHVRRWTGQSRQSLDFYARIEDLHRLSVQAPAAPLAEMALDADFADQSHMGRALKRATGFSPARLNRLIETEEAFWCYRLMGERF
ncbi:helix-turn-helix domain-containing protein [Hoeflea prorocentri]|uniref:Helix-turn-helix domain-containing protein n=1 Tax=Hoeflea prorocentri TaxID=1922333 RepID=A0A9X3UKM5_9HYPH|nr:helix-turn-helix domain-containing protein [Hoeflea prorocentri]MCY6382568.1 helix-turn-helix domain-containing protein [Hoeflea prorocentri]MDA5400368.1 helix-turn-helix domain-containing protein [Hoeflea prorocentri]